MLDHKGLEHRRVDIPTGMQPLVLRALGFREMTVPAMKINGRRVQGSLQISRALDEARPEPPLFPRRPRGAAALSRRRRPGASPSTSRCRAGSSAGRRRGTPQLRAWLASDAGIPAPAGRPPACRVRCPRGSPAAPEPTTSGSSADLRELPAHLDRVDALIADGTLDGESLNAADFQIATTTRTLLNMPPLRELVSGRPAERHAMRVAPSFGEEIPLTLPAGFEPARRAS